MGAAIDPTLVRQRQRIPGASWPSRLSRIGKPLKKTPDTDFSPTQTHIGASHRPSRPPGRLLTTPRNLISIVFCFHSEFYHFTPLDLLVLGLGYFRKLPTSLLDSYPSSHLKVAIKEVFE